MDEHAQHADVWMIHRDLARVPHYALPAGYRMRFYREGDLDSWLRIHATDRFFIPTAETFAAYLPGDTAYRATRIMFLVDPQGADIGTITAWNTDELFGRAIGRIHWVAIVPAAQGRGLAKPMLSAACVVLREQGYGEACLDTNTRRVPAINLYRHFGFEPFVRDERERAAWQAVAPWLKLPL
jgi:GNAT superfamily N-acetyltransferase